MRRLFSKTVKTEGNFPTHVVINDIRCNQKALIVVAYGNLYGGTFTVQAVLRGKRIDTVTVIVPDDPDLSLRTIQDTFRADQVEEVEEIESLIKRLKDLVIEPVVMEETRSFRTYKIVS